MGRKRHDYPIDGTRLLMTQEETAKVLGCGLTTVYLALRDGRLHGRRIGRRVMIERASLEQFVSELPKVGA